MKNHAFFSSSAMFIPDDGSKDPESSEDILFADTGSRRREEGVVFQFHSLLIVHQNDHLMLSYYKNVEMLRIFLMI